ncbi:hypothetical protein RSA36_19370 [Pantoea stewartii]|nr:hypothetical protein RSA30_15605 [Pantoea stewartii]KTT05806.1 hypothetical protein RSA36_19370 [Pantoea stewartii]
MNAFMVPPVALPAQQLEQLLKAVSLLVLRQFSQRLNHRIIATDIGLVKIDGPAQRKFPSCLGYAHRKHLVHKVAELILYRWFKAFFNDVLATSMLRLVLNVRVSAKLKCPSGLAKYLLVMSLQVSKRFMQVIFI